MVCNKSKPMTGWAQPKSKAATNTKCRAHKRNSLHRTRVPTLRKEALPR